MTGKQKATPKSAQEQRQSRREAALRANLARRKTQLRARGGSSVQLPTADSLDEPHDESPGKR